MKHNAKAPLKRRPWRIAKKISARGGCLHHGPHVYVARVAQASVFLDELVADSSLTRIFNASLLPGLFANA